MSKKFFEYEFVVYIRTPIKTLRGLIYLMCVAHLYF